MNFFLDLISIDSKLSISSLDRLERGADAEPGG